MKRIVLSFLVFTVMVMMSCNKYLDVDSYFDDTLKYDSIFSNYDYLSRYMWSISSDFPDESVFIENGTPGPLATDEAFTTMSKSQFRGLQYVLGDVNEDNISGLGMSIWGNMYKIVRKANIILARKGEAKLSTIENDEITGYTRFMRAYAYYLLIKEYGPVILVGDNVYPSNEAPAAYNNSRSSYDNCVEYICGELEEAAKLLPVDLNPTLLGRPSRGAAFSLIALLRLQHASPLYNGGAIARTYYGNWIDRDGKHYISQNYEERRWAVAAAAAKRVINMNKYSLHIVPIDETKRPRALPSNVSNAVFPNGAGGIDPLRSYTEMFNGETHPSKNPEYIWARFSNELTKFTQHSFPVNAIMGGWNAMCVPQKIIDNFYMEDGRDRNNASEQYPYKVSDNYNDEYFSATAITYSGYTIPRGVYGMYRNREMRFYASIGFSGRFWPANSCTQAEFRDKVAFYHEGTFSGNEIYSGKNASLTNPNDIPSTGYVITKFIHPDDAWKGTGNFRTTKSYAIIRFTEILLAYAESLNHLTGNYTIELPSMQGGAAGSDSYILSRDPHEISKYFNQVRYRVGLPGLSNDELASEAKIESIIERERMIEFLFENKRYYDVRRWGIYEQSELTGIYGMNLGMDKYSYYKNPTPINHANNRNRIIDRRMIWLPLPKAEIRRVEGLDQNPGWGN